MSNNIATKLQAILSAKGDIKAAIESKGVTVGNASLDQYASKIGEIQGGGEEDYMDDVLFIDYDGKVLYRYTAQEFLALTEMPANPEREGFTAQGWNWTLADAKAYVTECGMLVIGQMRITNDGKNRIYISLDDSDCLYISVALSGSGTVDWGDGSPIETNDVSYTSKRLYHTYNTIGDYTIITTGSLPEHPIGAGRGVDTQKVYDKIKKIHIGVGQGYSTYHFQYYTSMTEINLPNGCTSFSSGGVLSHCHSLKALVFPSSLGETSLGNYPIGDCFNLEIMSMHKGIKFGSTPFNKSISLKVFCASPWYWAFDYALSLKRASIPSSATSLSGSMFANCYSLKRVFLPNTITSLPSNCFASTYSLSELTIPSSVTSIGERAFQSSRIGKITIPSSVVSIGNYAFYQASSFYEVHMLSTTPPTIGTGIFQQAPIAHIYVPSESVEAYQTATNWSSYASIIEAEPTT